MYVTEGTVKNYVSRILEKLELRSRAELIVYLGGFRRGPGPGAPLPSNIEGPAH
ncbi:Bacterial regulatory protein, luxR family [compost metagenome]